MVDCLFSWGFGWRFKVLTNGYFTNSVSFIQFRCSNENFVKVIHAPVIVQYFDDFNMSYWRREYSFFVIVIIINHHFLLYRDQKVYRVHTEYRRKEPGTMYASKNNKKYSCKPDRILVVKFLFQCMESFR